MNINISFKNRIFLFLFLAFIFVLPFFVSASTSSGTIDSTYKYAWAGNAGWINLGCAHCNVQITDSGLTGYAWSQNYGWINLNPAQSGVKNDGNGNLSGQAWGEYSGWIDFSGVSIDSDGQFKGSTQLNDIIGKINYDCSGCKVTTDWRPVNIRGGGTVSLTTYSIPGQFVKSTTNPTITSLQSKIVELKALIASLTNKTPSSSSFTTNLSFGSRGNDVRQLQIFLNTHGYPVSTTGPGSPGNETTIFGYATKAALIRFQKANNIDPIGVMGPMTRGRVNSLIK